MMGDLPKENEKSPSLAIFLKVSNKSIDRIYHMLGGCEDSSKKEDASCMNIEPSLLDFDTLLSVANFAYVYDVEYIISSQLIKNMQQRLMNFFNGTLKLTEDNIEKLNKANNDLQAEILTLPFNISLERMRWHIAKSKKLGSKPELYQSSNSSITDILLSPNEEYILIMPMSHDKYVKTKDGRSVTIFPKATILNRKGTMYWEFVCTIHEQASAIWIDNNTFAYISADNSKKLIVGDIATKELKEIIFDSIDSIQKMFHTGKIVFSCISNQGQLGIGTYDEESKKTTYNFLDNMGDILCFDKQGGLLLYDKEQKIVYRVKNLEIHPEAEVVLELQGNISSLIASSDGKKIAVLKSINVHHSTIEVYSLDGQEEIKYEYGFELRKLKFSKDNQYLIAIGDKVIIVSALIKEIIGELDSNQEQALLHILAAALSSDNNTVLIGFGPKQEPISGLVKNLMGIKPTNVLIWDFIPKKYLSAWGQLQEQPRLFKYIYPVVSWYYRSQNEKMPIKLSHVEMGIFHSGFSYDVQQLLTDVGIIAPGQLSKKSQQPAQKIKTQPERSNKVNQLQSQESVWQKIMRATGAMAKDFLNYISKMSNALPGSG
jgi:WD40 repeat protein